MGADSLALGGEAQAASGAFEEAMPQPFFELCEPLGDDRGHHAQCRGCASQAARMAHGKNQLKITAVHSFLDGKS